MNAVLLTAAANEKTHYHLQHFPVDLELQAQEIFAAARGELVTRYVVLKDPNRAPVQTTEGETVEARESFTGPNSFQEAIAESRKHGELLVVLVLGPESKLQRGFTLPQSAQTGGWEQELNPYSNRRNPYGEDAIIEEPKSVNTPAEIPTEEASRWQPQPAGSVSTEMRQLRQEVRSLREQLGKLVEVLSQENRTKPGVDRPVPVSVDPNTDPIDRGTDSGPDTGDGIGSTNRSTTVPSPFSVDPGTETLPPPIKLFESETGLITPETTTRKPSLKPRPKPVRGETLPVESEVIPQPESRPVPVKEIPVPSTEAD